MINFKVPFEYLAQKYVALVTRDRPLPDFVSVEEPNNLILPRIFMIQSKKLNGLPLLSDHPGLALKIAGSIEEFCKKHPALCI